MLLGWLGAGRGHTGALCSGGRGPWLGRWLVGGRGLAGRLALLLVLDLLEVLLPGSHLCVLQLLHVESLPVR